MADQSLNAIHLGDGFNIDTQPHGSIVGHTFTDADAYGAMVDFTGLAEGSGDLRRLSEDGVGASVRTDAPGGDAAFQDLRKVTPHRIRIVSDDGAGGAGRVSFSDDGAVHACGDDDRTMTRPPQPEARHARAAMAKRLSAHEGEMDRAVCALRNPTLESGKR